MNIRIVTLALSFVLMLPNLYAEVRGIRRMPDPVQNSYLVKLRNTLPEKAADTAHEMAVAFGGRVSHVWRESPIGFSITMPEAAAERLSKHPLVAIVEEDGYLYQSTVQNTNYDPDSGQTTAGNPLWHLDRIDQQSISFSELDKQYRYCDSGFGVKAYVLDSGVLKTHKEFWRSTTDHTSRVENGTATTTDSNGDPFYRTPAPGDNEDYGTNPCNVMGNGNATYQGGHGTAVASALGGLFTGVAKTVTIVPVKVSPCSAPSKVSDMIAGLQWIKQQQLDYPDILRVANISMFRVLAPANPTPGECTYGDVYPDLTTQELTLFEENVLALIESGVTVVVSANNQNIDARNTTPARLSWDNPDSNIGPYRVITVAGISDDDSRWVTSNPNWDACKPITGFGNTDPGSNYGPAVDIFAPSDQMMVAHIAPTETYRTQGTSGTSFAAPMVAGVAARVLGQYVYGTTPYQVWARIAADSTKNEVTNPGTGSPNRLLYRWGYSNCRLHIN